MTEIRPAINAVDDFLEKDKSGTDSKSNRISKQSNHHKTAENVISITSPK